jgi:1,2-phenylacetyl-CoA epoxidase PaaB subunit
MASMQQLFHWGVQHSDLSTMTEEEKAKLAKAAQDNKEILGNTAIL